MIRIAQPLIGDEERAAVMAVLDSGQLAAGPVTRSLEERFAAEVSHTRHAVAVANGTAALHLALLAHDIGRDDDVITTPFTFQATANMILAAGARPIFVDVGADGNIDTYAAEMAITANVKAILPVHLYGRLCDMDELTTICDRYGFSLIEDAAQAHGASIIGKRAGSFGTGCFSFYATKNVTSGEGGMITTDDDALAARLRRLRHHGQNDTYSSLELGFNYRTTDVTAAIALAQLDRLEEFTQRRRENAAYLSKHLTGVVLPPEPVEPEAMVWHQYTVRVSHGRDELRAYLRDREIESSVYYPTLLPDQPLYRRKGLGGGDFPNARRLAVEVLSLPVHPALSQPDLERIVEAVNEWTASRQSETSAVGRP